MKKRIFTYLMLICSPFLLLAQWSDNPMLNTEIIDTTGDQVLPKVVVNADNGESYISWFSNSGDGNYNVYMQRLDVNGNKMWAEDGILISNHPTMSWVTDYDLVIDNDGCAILVTQDERTGSSDVFAYRISPEGEFLWGADGIALTNDPDFNPSPKAIIDQEGNIIVNWGSENNTTFSKLYFQKLSPDGDLLWDENTVISSDSMHLLMPDIILSEDTATTVVWIQTVSTDTAEGNWPKMYFYAQKIDKNGNLAWSDIVAIDTAENMPLAFFSPTLASDENRGFFVGWSAFPVNALTHSCYVQHINSAGEAQWTQNGILASDSVQFGHSNPKLTYLLQNDELFLFWTENRDINANDNHTAILGQKFSNTGEKLWTSQGTVFDGWYSTYDTVNMVLGISPATDNDFTVFFEKEYEEVSPDTLIVSNYHAMRIDGDGDFVWDNAKPVISSALSTKALPVFSNLVSNQWVVAWSDNRNDPQYEGVSGIYAQNISIDGDLGIITGINEITQLSDNSILNYPNPFQNQTTIEYELTQGGNVSLSLMDVNGRLIKHLFIGQQQKGIHTFQLNASGLSPGMYLVAFKHDGLINYHKILVNN